MASNNRQSVPRSGFYDEVSFKPLIDTLRNESSDDTPIKDNYVGLYRNVYDMISSDDDKIIKKLKFDKKTNSFIITYSDNSVDTITLTDSYLLSASYSHISGIATFILNNGDLIKLDLNDLKSQFNKISEQIETINTKIENIEYNIENIEDGMKWHSF